MTVDLIREPKNFSGIENVFRIKGVLDLAHHIQKRVAQLVAHVFGARYADTVLSRKRTSELPNKHGGLIGNQSILSQILRRVQIQDRPDVKQTAGGVAVVTRLE